MPMVLLRCLLAWEPKKNAVPAPCDSSLHASRAYRIPTAAALEAVVMGKPRVKPNYRRRVLRLPDLDWLASFAPSLRVRQRPVHRLVLLPTSAGPSPPLRAG